MLNKDTIIELFEEFEENKRELNEKQIDFLDEKYNLPFARFQYAEGHLCYMFKGKKSHIGKLKHYVGFEYEEDVLESIIQHNNEVLLVYGMADRVMDFVEKLQKLESN